MNIYNTQNSSLPTWYVRNANIPPGFRSAPEAHQATPQDAFSNTLPEPAANRPSFSPMAAPPLETSAPAPAVDNSALLRSLESIKSTAGDAGYQAGQLSDSLANAQSTQPKYDAEAAAWTLRSAEADNENTDSSAYGREAQSKLDSISGALSNLVSGSWQMGSLSSAISTIRGQLASIDRSRLSDPSRLDNISSSLSLLESNLSGAQSSVSKAEGAVGNARYSLSQGGYYVAQVSADQEGMNVSSAASSARGYVETLAGDLESVRSNAQTGGDNLRSMKGGFGDIADDADALIWQIRG